MQRFLAMAALLCLTFVARADWVELGAATYCSSHGKGFALLPIALTDDEATTIGAPEGYRVLPLGENQTIVCKVGASRVLLQISNYGPQERGAGRGSGVLMISSLTIDGTAVLKDSANFNWKVLDERVLTSIAVRPVGRHAEAVFCTSKGFDWRDAYAEQQCEVK